MYEYKVVLYNNIKAAEDEMNKLAKAGWRVISVSIVAGTVVTYERPVKQ